MKKTQPIGVFDSGIGGLTVLDELIKMFPGEHFIYVADEAYEPYGRKTNEEIAHRVQSITKFLLSKNVKAIVIACNTASVHIQKARELTNIPVISVIQPTAKKAISLTENGKIAVLATISTINNAVYQNIINENGKTPVPLACSEFVDFLEHNPIDDPQGEIIVRNKLQAIKDEGFDTLIHGCTHFSLLEEHMRTVLGDKINYVVCGRPTGEALYEILSKKGLINDSPVKGEVEIFTTGSVESTCTTMKWFKDEHDPVCHKDIEY